MELREYQLKREEQKLQKRKQTIDLIKFLGGTVILGLIGIFINYQIQQNKLEFQAKQSESEYLKAFLETYLEANEIQKRDFLQFMIYASSDEQTSSRFKRLYLEQDAIVDSLLNRFKTDSSMLKLRIKGELIKQRDDSIRRRMHNIRFSGFDEDKEFSPPPGGN